MSGALERNAVPLVRSGGLKDAKALAGIYIETWRSAYPGILADKVLLDLSPARQEAVWAEVAIRGGNSVLLVSEDETGAVAGFVSAGPARPRVPGYRGEIYTLYVDQDRQDRGHGRALLRAALDALAGRGLAPANLWVLAENPARFFYERLGGSIVGRRQDRLGGQEHDEIAYGWDDPTGATASAGTARPARPNPIKVRP